MHLNLFHCPTPYPLTGAANDRTCCRPLEGMVVYATPLSESGVTYRRGLGTMLYARVASFTPQGERSPVGEEREAQSYSCLAKRSSASCSYFVPERP